MDSDSDDSGDDDEEEEGENSPIEIVAMTVSTFDDPTLPCLTFRFWVMGTFFTVLGAATSLVFYFRPTPFQFSVFFVQLASYPLGVLMAKTLPRKKYSLFGKYFYLNPGPFNMKEHMLIAVAVNTGGSVAYAIDVLAIQRLYYQMDVGALNAIVLLITTQCIGYGMAGFLRNILIKPANMVWPSMLVQVALYNTLHAAESVSRNFNRQRFFFIVFCCAFLYNFLPGYIAPALSSVALLCMTLPNSPVAQVLGSGIRGMGLLNVSLDWTMVGAFGPLYTPWWAQLNFYVGVIIAVWVVAPSLYLTNTMNAQLYEPVMVTQYDEEANEYDINRILRDNYEVDEAKLNAYSGLRMSPYIVFLYFMALAAVASTLMHVFLYYRHTIYRQFRASRKEKEDVHSRMMRAYPEVPVSWYIGIFVAMLVAAIVVCEMSSIRLPWWAVLVAVTIAGFMSLPMGIIQAISNNRVGLNVLSELVGGYMLPGKPIANATFKAFGYMTMFQCLLLVEDLKLGHYMKIPPRKLFVVQVWGTVVGALVNYGLFEWMLWMKGDVLTGKVPDPTGQWATRNSQTYFAASLIWGAYGPHRMFGPESPYRIVLWGFLVGILLPIPFYFLHKRFPGGKWHLVNIPILATGMHVVPLAPPTFIMSSFIIAFVFQYFIYRRHHGWWKRNTYILSAALDAGTQVSTLFIVFGLSTVAFPGWFGNNNNSGNIERCNVDMMRDAADL
ncbi:OPT oligopeptide transporter protein-domain-containing protein [Syncephalis pseudoplumigaleata]|uniref:OPT oligopeptide transporter protein-domain-containing protein n=1 Tax=Syncephalis pseudoplumigaleata TaxID=1712513 RepID=A0A4P9Z435_9FUNG|nr:OPT oligopeptide transporter protein-domain-containing protein [Syncephalis pseudoplumigaleata]|eukprot:RKP27323.1 OPT oligopeptide transporter protein-domain-containing protein [Syncephalis pseudoplumigaleata]